MQIKMRTLTMRTAALLTAGALSVAPSLCAQAPAGNGAGNGANSGDDAAIRADIQKQLNGKRFGGVQVDVQNGAVMLAGQVDRYMDKMDAEHKAHRVVGKDAVVRDGIVVSVAAGISDQELGQKLAKGLQYDRVGYGTTMFNAIGLSVQNGVVTLSGMVVGPPDKDSAMNLVAQTLGVRDIVDHLQVAPLSPNDDRLRRQLAAAIYGAPALNRYAQDPAKTIRIVVANGHVTLVGVVDNNLDRQLAYQKANGVAGVFSVQNDLQVAGAERQ